MMLGRKPVPTPTAATLSIAAETPTILLLRVLLAATRTLDVQQSSAVQLYPLQKNMKEAGAGD
jgi:hypothetical protein